jgi:hypothetical protein
VVWVAERNLHRTQFGLALEPQARIQKLENMKQDATKKDFETHERAEWWRRKPSRFEDASQAANAFKEVCNGTSWKGAKEPK